jgi:hypothetical protein
MLVPDSAPFWQLVTKALILRQRFFHSKDENSQAGNSTLVCATPVLLKLPKKTVYHR